MAGKSRNLLKHLSQLPDPRSPRGQRHLLVDVLTIAVLATICGINDWEGIAEFGREEEAWLRTFLALPHGIPSHDTFNLIFSRIDPKAFTGCFMQWVKALRKKVHKEVVAIDGKTARASGDGEQPPLHMVSAWADHNRLVLGQRAVDTKSNEIKAIPELLKMLTIKGCIVTIDATIGQRPIGPNARSALRGRRPEGAARAKRCQKNIAKQIVAKKADYVLAVKGNQESLHQAIMGIYARCDAGEAMPQARWDYTETGHGRVAHRKVTTLDAVYLLPPKILFAWSNLNTLVRIESKTEREGKQVEEVRYHISSLPMRDPETIGRAVQSHWGIENELHWVLDVVCNEDHNRTRKGNAPQNGTLLRHVALNLLRQDPVKRSIPKRQLKAMLSRDYRLEALFGFENKE